MNEGLPISIDLVVEAKNHINFLRNLHINGMTLSKPSYESFRRYSDLWLPFVMNSTINSSETPTHDLIPPADIAWLWHCHRLAPYRYAKYIQRRFFSKDVKTNDEAKTADETMSKHEIKILDATHPFTFQMENNSNNDTLTDSIHGEICKRTKELFNEMYPDECFFLDKTKALQASSTGTGSTHLDGFDVVGSCERQASFLWQVSGPTFSNNTFLLLGAENYSKFVLLMAKRDRPQFLVPTYQIDLMWHTHMLSSIAKYHADNMRITGTILEHDDSLNDRTEGGTLDSNFQATRKLWSDVYGVEYKVPGGMYRGEPPVDFFKCDWPETMSRGDVNARHPNMEEGFGYALAHLIGQVGASSHGRTVWLSINDAAAFKPANPKSTLRNVNANDREDGYIFGKGDKGIGYYSLQCRDTYDILIKGLDKMIARKKSEKGCTTCFMVITVLGLLCVSSYTKSADKKISELQDAKLLAMARRDSANPSADLVLPAELEKRLEKYRRSKSDDSTGGYYYDDGAYYTYAAACGATGGFWTDGGGGGDGAGAGCGGGGGGCGGGGCGG